MPVNRKPLRGKPKFDLQKCNGCGACSQSCPSSAIDIKDGEKRQIVLWLGRCIFCGRCETICPTGSVKMLDELPHPSANKMKTERVELELARCVQCGDVISTKQSLKYVATGLSGSDRALSEIVTSRVWSVCVKCKRRLFCLVPEKAYE